MILSSKQNSRIDVEGHMKTYKEHGSNSPKKLNSPSNAENKINVRQFLDSKLFFKNAKGQKVKINIIGKKLDDIKTTEQVHCINDQVAWENTYLDKYSKKVDNVNNRKIDLKLQEQELGLTP